jgi:polysaccharide export outer membrane protein
MSRVFLLANLILMKFRTQYFSFFGVLLLLTVVVLNGCIPQKESVYLQDISERKDYKNPYGEMDNITDRYYLMPNDYLYVHVNTPDPKLSEFFNPTRAGSQGGGAQQNQRFFYYLIDDGMNIDFPYVGEINLSGCNVVKAKDRIEEALKPFLKEANLTVKLATSTYTVLGEVGSPGVINMEKEQITIFEALAKAGDVRPFGKKKKVKLLRQTPQGEVTYVIDLTDQNIVNSEYYYIYPNDLIYIRPMKAKNWGIGESFSIGMVSTVLALFLTINALVK